MRFFIFFFSLFLTLTADSNQCTMFPKNDLYFPAPMFRTIAQGEFEKAMADARKVYEPLAKKEGATLTIRGDWQDGTVNAWASKQGNQWTVQMYGGMARHPDIGAYGFHVVLCHELGHLFGAAPTYSGQRMASEGQADYFSTAKCIRKLYKGIDPPAVSSEASNLCRSKWQLKEDIDVCEIGLEGGEALGNVLADLGGSSTPSLSKEDPKIVSSTQTSHPQAQCRLDTYKRGALCSVSEMIDFSYTDHKQGACLTKELQRPLCWYKPNYTTDPEPDPCVEDPQSCEPEPSEIPPDFAIGSVSGLGLMFTLPDDMPCERVRFEVKKGKFTEANSEDEDKKSYLFLTTDGPEETTFIVPHKYFKRKVDNYIRYHCFQVKTVFGKASNAKKYRRK